SAVFITDTVLAVLAFGFIRTPRSYLRRTPWNVLDFLVTLACIVDIILSRLEVTSALRAVKIAFVLRPLRILKNSPGIKIVVRSMFTAIPAMKDVFIVAFIFWTAFAIAGVQLFKGEFYSCSDSSFTLQANCTAAGARWVNAELHFDNFGAAMITLFVLSTLEGWVPIMHNGIDAVRPGVAPILNYNPAAALFFVVFIIVGGFFLVQLFMSVLVNTYEEQKRQLQQKSIFLTPEQEEWLNCQKMVLASVPLDEYLVIPVGESAPSPTRLHRFRVASLKFILSLQFRRFVNFSIIANAVSVGVDHYPISDTGARALFALNMLFTALFAIEAILKNVALTPRVYFLSNWNRFDFVVLLASIIGLVLEYTLEVKWSFATTLRTVRIMRIAVSPNSNRETLRRIV
ncbi:MAG: ion transporter, partial [Flavobacteriaceae bacterium]|nr:ion transporter [Flavobacteriaceae bacterium]